MESQHTQKASAQFSLSLGSQIQNWKIKSFVLFGTNVSVCVYACACITRIHCVLCIVFIQQTIKWNKTETEQKHYFHDLYAYTRTSWFI